MATIINQMLRYSETTKIGDVECFSLCSNLDEILTMILKINYNQNKKMRIIELFGILMRFKMITMKDSHDLIDEYIAKKDFFINIGHITLNDDEQEEMDYLMNQMNIIYEIV